MAAAKITELTALTTIATGDLFVTVDISDTTMGVDGTNKKITWGSLMAAPGAIGGTTPDTGAFTTVSASTLVSTVEVRGLASGPIQITGTLINFFNQGGAALWQINGTSGDLLAGADGAYDIGASASGRPENIFISGRITSLYFRSGTGDPEGVVAAPVGAIYNRTDGGTGTALYVKETGTTTSNGWVAK